MQSANITKLALVGVGKIARDQHFPSIAKNASFDLAATVSPDTSVDGVDNFDTISALVAARPDISAVAICTPPQVRFQLAWDCLSAGKHVLLEKSPGASLSEVETLLELAQNRGLTLYATWHSRHGLGVEPARHWMAERPIKGVRVIWKEDVRHWHPNQAWIWEAGNLGVFDPAINALSILTRIMPYPIYVSSADLEFPSNCETPIAATATFSSPLGVDTQAVFDWRHEGEETWDIIVETDDGTLVLSNGGNTLRIDGELIVSGDEREYDSVYEYFAQLLASNQTDVDVAPLRHVADMFMRGKRHVVDPFYDTLPE